MKEMKTKWKSALDHAIKLLEIQKKLARNNAHYISMGRDRVYRAQGFLKEAEKISEEIEILVELKNNLDSLQ